MYPNNKNILKNLTIVIPSYNRQSYLIRIIEYWSNKNVKLIILDGSKRNIKNKIKKFNKNIKYIHKPVGLYERLLCSIKLIKTKYVMLGSDDEFYIPSALIECLKFLSANQGYGCCTGQALGFNFKKGKIYAYNQYKELRNLKLNNSNPNKRVKKHFLNYVPAHLYSVCKSNIWKTVAKATFSKEYNFYAAWEIQFEFLILFSKKSIALPNLLWLRSRENEPIRENSPSMSFSKSFSDWWIDNKFIKEKKEFLLRMEKTCKKINKINGNKIDAKIDKSFQYLYNYNYNNLHFLKKGLFYPIYKFILIIFKLPLFPKKIFKKIYNLLNYNYQKSQDIPMNSFIHSLENNGVKIDKKELKKIEKLIIFFHKKINK